MRFVVVCVLLFLTFDATLAGVSQTQSALQPSLLQAPSQVKDVKSLISDPSGNSSAVLRLLLDLAKDNSTATATPEARGRHIAVDALWAVVSSLSQGAQNSTAVARDSPLSESDKDRLLAFLQWPIVDTMQKVVASRSFGAVYRALKQGAEKMLRRPTEQQMQLLEWVASDPASVLEHVKQQPAVKELLGHEPFLRSVDAFMHDFVRPANVPSDDFVSFLEMGNGNHVHDAKAHGSDSADSADSAAEGSDELVSQEQRQKSKTTTKLMSLLLSGTSVLLLFLFLVDIAIRRDSSNFNLPDLTRFSAFDSTSTQLMVRYGKLWLAIIIIFVASSDLLWGSLGLFFKSQDAVLKLHEAVKTFIPSEEQDQDDDDAVSLLEIFDKQTKEQKAHDEATHDERVGTLAQRVMAEMEKGLGSVPPTRIAEIMAELGFDKREVRRMEESVEDLGSRVTARQITKLTSHRLFGVRELFSQGGTTFLVAIITCLCIAIAILMLTQNHLDLMLGTMGILMVLSLAVLVLVLLARAIGKEQEGQSQINSYFSSMMETGTRKISTMIMIVMMFAMLDHFFLRVCSNASPQCSNNALPVCIGTGLPPKYPQCSDSSGIVCHSPDSVDGTTQEAAVCPDENVPGAVSDDGMISSEFRLTKPTVLVAATNSFMCNAGMFSSLCQRAHRYTYGPGGVLVDVVNVFKAAGLGGNTKVAQITASDKGTNCSSLYTPTTLTNFGVSDLDASDTVPLYTPSKSSGVAVYDLCYRLNTSRTFQLLKGPTPTDPLPVPWDAYLVIGDSAECSSKDCSSSDFTESMSRELFDSMYFAMITHSSVGYGDITPISSRGMMFVSLHAIVMMMIALV